MSGTRREMLSEREGKGGQQQRQQLSYRQSEGVGDLSVFGYAAPNRPITFPRCQKRSAASHGSQEHGRGTHGFDTAFDVAVQSPDSVHHAHA